MRCVVMKALKDGSGRVCIHWLRLTADGPVQTPGRVVQNPQLGPMAFGGKRGMIACNPEQNTVATQQRGNEFFTCFHSDDPRAVTCEKCMETAEFKEIMGGLADTISEVVNG